MTTVHPADRSLTLITRRLTSVRRADEIARGWSDDIGLRGWTPVTVLDALAHQGHPHHDQLVRALVIRSQHDDHDAAVLLLAALRPALWKLAHIYHRRHLWAAFGELLVNAVFVIDRCDPSVDRLYDRLVGRIRAATPPVRPDYREQSTGGPTDRALDLEDDIIDHIEACDRLHHLGQLRRAGAVTEQAWHELLATRVEGLPAKSVARGRSAHHARADISRLARRLERIVAA